MIRAEQLQIGDWVKYTNPPYIRVASITKKKIGYHLKDNEPRMHYVRLCEVESIPLTDHLLEKNGIRYQFGMPWYQGGVDGVYEFRYMSDDIKTEMKLPVKYLHELQQALRFCGINKTIEP